MDYKYYTFDGDGYQFRSTNGVFYIAAVIFTIPGAIGIWYAIDTKTIFGYIFGAVCVLLILLVLNATKHKIIIRPDTKTVTIITSFKKEIQFPFSEFLNFQVTNHISNSILHRTRVVSMYFNENGKNKNVYLGQTNSKKKVNTIIAETAELLGKNDRADINGY